MRTLSIEEDYHDDPKHERYEKMKFWAAIFLPIAGFSSAVVIWLWLMSVDPHWYSTMFAWYTGASCFVSMIALTILFLIYLKSRGHYHNVNMEHFHDLGKFMFAFSVFWTYLWFSQYMLIWYGNIGEETVYFQTRIREYPVLFYGNLVLNFVLPFLILIRNDTKRKYGTLIIVSLIVFFGHWWDTFQMVKPGTLHTSHEVIMEKGNASGTADLKINESNTSEKSTEHHGSNAEEGHGTAHSHEVPVSGYFIPGLADIGVLLGFLALFFATTMHFLSKASLVPKNDPFLKESLHHHV
jgi:Ni/Fe-hydrogenase subunit HybB-like protein